MCVQTVPKLPPFSSFYGVMVTVDEDTKGCTVPVCRPHCFALSTEFLQFSITHFLSVLFMFFKSCVLEGHKVSVGG